MFLDALLRLADGQALTVDANSTNVIDLGPSVPSRRIGTGEPMCVVVSIGVAADFGDANETYTFNVIQSATENMATPTIIATRTMLATQLTLGVVLAIPIPPGTPTQRYIALALDSGGTTPAVTISAFLSPQSFFDEQPDAFYAKAFTVS